MGKVTRTKFSQNRLRDIRILFLDERIFKSADEETKKLVRSFCIKAMENPLSIVPNETFAAERVFLDYILPEIWNGNYCLSGKLAYRSMMFDIYDELHDMGLAVEVFERKDLSGKTDCYYGNNPSFSEDNFLERWKPVRRNNV